MIKAGGFTIEVTAAGQWVTFDISEQDQGIFLVLTPDQAHDLSLLLEEHARTVRSMESINDPT